MSKCSFSRWLLEELATARMALLALLEEEDRLRYMVGPVLKEEYLAKIGAYEEQVLESELDVSMLERKVELIQIAINRREPIDMEKIEAQLAEEREVKIEVLNATSFDAVETNGSDLGPSGEAEEFQRMYREIISTFHPKMNPGLTETQKQLYEKAQDAYRNRNHEAMRLIYEMLFGSPGEKVLMAVKEGNASALEDAQEISDLLSADYTLAKSLYGMFTPLESDKVLMDSMRECKTQSEALMESIEKMKEEFPFNAKEILRDQAKQDEYLGQLKMRQKQCEDARQELTRKIEKMTGVADHG